MGMAAMLDRTDGRRLLWVGLLLVTSRRIYWCITLGRWPCRCREAVLLRRSLLWHVKLLSTFSPQFRWRRLCAALQHFREAPGL